MQDKTIDLDGKKYKLVPIEEVFEVEEDPLDDYIRVDDVPEKGTEDEETDDGTIPDAVGVKSEYRQKFLDQKLTRSDFAQLPSLTRSGKLHQPSQTNFDKFDGQTGYKTFYGDGVTVL